MLYICSPPEGRMSSHQRASFRSRAFSTPYNMHRKYPETRDNSMLLRRHWHGDSAFLFLAGLPGFLQARGNLPAAGVIEAGSPFES